MPWTSPHSDDTRAAVEAMLRDTDLTMIEIGRRLGVSPGTVSTWNGRAGLRRPRRVGRPGLSPAEWPETRLQALARLYYAPANDPGDLALALGLGRSATRALFLAAGFTRRRDRSGLPPTGLPPPPGGAVPTLSDLDAAIRVQIGRQIAAFDAALHGQGAAVIDSARVLRDLGGLKRLLDDLSGPTPTQDGDADGERDLAGLRDRLARRFAALPAPSGAPDDPGEPERG